MIERAQRREDCDGWGPNAFAERSWSSHTMPLADAEMPLSGEDSGSAGIPDAQRLIESVAAWMSFVLYRRHFELVRANSGELRDLAYRLRYQVYAHERSFEDPADHPDGRESDEYDARSLHILLRHRGSGIVVGTARLVLPQPDEPSNSFPVQALSSHSILHDPSVVPHAVEFSRLAISRERLRRCRIGSAGRGLFSTDPANRDSKLARAISRALFPQLSAGLIAAVIELAAENGYPILFSVMEPHLIRKLEGIGIQFPFVDAPVDYHGLRHPCALPSLYDACQTMKSHDRVAWEIVTNRGRTQELALTAQTGNEAARRAVARAYRLAKRPAPLLLHRSNPAFRGKWLAAMQSHPIISYSRRESF